MGGYTECMTQSRLLVSTAAKGADLSDDAPRYSLLVARDSEEVRAAQRLRYRVFAEEMGANISCRTAGVDEDYFDEFCDHLVVRDDRSQEIVGTYRMLPPERAAAAGRLYSDTEFELSALNPLRESLVEAGRSCVHPDHRTGSVVGLVWAGIARYMLLSGHSWLAGCASVPLTDGGSYAASVWDIVRTRHYAPEEYRVTRATRGTPTAWSASRRPPCPRCSRATCGSAPGCADVRRTTRSSAWPTCTCCCPCSGSTRAT